MIGVVARADQRWAVEEFFELFKTPWEWGVPGRRYGAVLCTTGRADDRDTSLVLVYSSDPADGASASGRVGDSDGRVSIAWRDGSFPIYGGIRTFDGSAADSDLQFEGRPLQHQQQSAGRVVHRIGYDLFDEVRYLLEQGQPASEAATPTLELHIALLRSLLLDHRVPFVEVPPSPEHHDFICCLTHDVDFFGIRRHRLDRTLAGFVARASAGTLVDVVRRRRPLSDAVRNWSAVLSLPLVFLGIARDFWRPFDDYARVERGLPSTFFLLPFRGRPGIAPSGQIDPTRAAPYQLSEIREDVSRAAAAGAEIGIHGIDAWRDAGAGRDELSELTSITGSSSAGIRMHWLYFSAQSPRQLEAAGFDYDSSWGYNETVGYRAGTSQAFRLPGAAQILELPLAIMDTALFYKDRMGLDEHTASAVCAQLVANARRFGGTLVVNWHCRSVAPERLWGRFYQRLLATIAERGGVWFAAAGEAAGWYRWRRSIRFTTDETDSSVTIDAPPGRRTWPAAVIRVHRPAAGGARFEELPFTGQHPVVANV